MMLQKQSYKHIDMVCVEMLRLKRILEHVRSANTHTKPYICEH